MLPFGPVTIGAAVLIALRWRMNVMSLPEEARSLGVATGRWRRNRRRRDTDDLGQRRNRRRHWLGRPGSALWRARWLNRFRAPAAAAAILGGGYLLLIDTLARTAAEVEIPLA